MLSELGKERVPPLRSDETRALLDLAIEHFEIAQRCERAAGYVAVSGHWVDSAGPEKRAILEEERARQYALGSECIAAIGRVKAG